ARLKTDAAFTALAHPNAGIFFTIGLNTLNAPLNNKTVRQAMNYALDRKRFTDSVMFGLGKVQSLPWLPGSPAFEQSHDTAYGYDLDKARSLLAEAGVGNFEMHLVL